MSARIYRQLLDAVLDGRLRPSARLPPTRDLARRLAVSRNTVAVAYERLIAEGFLTGRVGAGTFVRAQPQPFGRTQVRHAPAGAGVHPRKLWDTIPPLVAMSGPSSGSAAVPYDFRAGVPDSKLFPLTSWRRLVARELRPQAARGAIYGDPAGHASLRAAIARFIGISRSVRADADDVIVTHGAQQALDLIGRVLIDPGTVVALEEPGYPPARAVFRSHGARVVPVPVDDEGLVVSAIPAAARLVYVTPSHQFPLGTVMSLQRRAALLAWAERREAVIIEDDYDTEFRFEGRPLDPLQSLDRSGRVLYVGTFSKVMLPTLRVGFLIAPASLQPALRLAKQLTDWYGELPTQAALARFIDDGLLARHIRKAGREYATRRERIASALQRDFAEWLELVPSAAGLHLTARLRPKLRARLNLDDVVARAAANGVVLTTLARYYFALDLDTSANAKASAITGTGSAPAPSTAGLLIGYGAIATQKVDEGMRRLAAAFTSAPPASRRASPARYSAPAGE